MATETIFTMDTSSIKFGPGATHEVGYEMARLGATRVMVVTDRHLARSRPVGVALDALRGAGLDAVLYDRARVEPTDESLEDAAAAATAGRFDGYVAVGGGSAMDTAKAANLYATYPAPLLTYVNAPVGDAKPVPGPLRPLIAIPTTAGTGSETTGVAIFDYTKLHAKTGIAHRALRPALGIVDPENTRTLPRMVAAASGLDVLSHAVESYTALPFQRRAAPEHPRLRPAYQGANPISDVWAAKAIELVSQYLLRAVYDPADDEARAQMMLAAAFAGIGFGNAGVHLPHGMSYPVSGMVQSYRPDGYPTDHALVPHGLSVILCAPAVFRWTAEADPPRHLDAARMLGAPVDGVTAREAGDVLAGAIVGLMRKLELPNGLRAVGYGPQHVDALVAGTTPQHRVTKLSPRPAGEADLRQLFMDSMELW